MIAVLCDRYGPPEVLRVADVPTPVPTGDEVRIRVHAATVTSGDVRVRGLRVPRGFALPMRLALGVSGPRQPILGTEVAGVVDALGPLASRFRVGDRVVAFTDFAMGGHAAYRCLSEQKAVVHAPAALSDEEAAAMSFGGTTALHFLRRAALQPGEAVLVNGAAGGVGTACVQLAAHLGGDVTGVCRAANDPFVRALGARTTVDYTQTDVAALGPRFDLVLDVAGTLPYRRAQALLRPGGRLVLLQAGLPEMLAAPWHTATSPHRVVAGTATGNADALRTLAAFADAGVFRPPIDRRYPLEQAAEAHRYVETGRKRGHVVLTVAG